MKFGLGQSVTRVEDPRLLTGRGRYSDDIVIHGMAHGFVLRSPHAAADIKNIDISAAEKMPGVLEIITGEELLADKIGDLPCLAQFNKRNGDPLFKPPHPALARSAVHHVGDGVAFVVAENRKLAEDAAEAVVVDYEPKTAITNLSEIGPDAPAVWSDCPDNLCFDFEAGNREGADKAFAAADRIASLDFVVNRVAPAAMEPRAAVATYDSDDQRYTLYTGTQAPHTLRRIMATVCLGIPETDLRVVSPDLGGGFGMRSDVYAEWVMVLCAARRIGRPVKWNGTRMEGFVSDNQGRDNRTRVELALNKDGDFLGLRVRTMGALGAYLSLGATSPLMLNIGGLAGVYTTPAIHVEIKAYFSNTPSTAPYRGAGRPEASFAIERVIDLAAREMGIDSAELRRRNTIPSSAMPYKTGLTFTYDCGEFEKNMDTVLANANYSEFEDRRKKAKDRGKLLGFGIANIIERAAAMGEETADIRFDSTGTVTLTVGTHSHGQGHETVFRQLLNDVLGLPFDRVRFVQGDTDKVAHGFGTFGSRSSGLAGAAIQRAAIKLIEKGKRIVAHEFEVAVSDIDFDDGTFRVTGTDLSKDIFDVAKKAYMAATLPRDIEPGFYEHATYSPTGPTFPNGCHACEVEIDPDTGQVALTKYWVTDDVGVIMNPLLVKGQVHGGVAQGVGQILTEDMRWDPETGQPLTGSFLDYGMPRADDLPSIEVTANVVPTPTNPLGIKGAGEAGTVGAMPCVMNAIADALAPIGATPPDMPATPERVWRAISEA